MDSPLVVLIARVASVAIFLFMLAALGHADALEDVKRDVDSRITPAYPTQEQWRSPKPIPSGERGTGHCIIYAMTYQYEAAKRGVDGKLKFCFLPPTKENPALTHMFFVADDGRVLDNQQSSVGTIERVGCIGDVYSTRQNEVVKRMLGGV